MYKALTQVQIQVENQRKPSEITPLTSRHLLDDTQQTPEQTPRGSPARLIKEDVQNLTEEDFKATDVDRLADDQLQNSIEPNTPIFRAPTVKHVKCQKIQDPLSGISFMDQMTRSNLIRNSLKSPFDFSQTVQTISNPLRPNEYITVQKVSLNTWHFKTKIQPQKSVEDYVCTQNHSLKYTKYESTQNRRGFRSANSQKSNTESQKKCDLCDNLSDNLWVCQHTDSSQTHLKVCPHCFATCYSNKKINAKSFNHQLWIPFNFSIERGIERSKSVKDLQTPSQKYNLTEQDVKQLNENDSQKINYSLAVIGLWKEQVDHQNILCYRQFYVENPVYFPQQHCKGHDAWEMVFLHQGEQKNELFFFQQDASNQMYISKVDLDAILSSTTHQFQSSLQFGRDLYSLPVKQDQKQLVGPNLRKIIKKNFKISAFDAKERDLKDGKRRGEPNIATEFQCLPRLFNDTIIIQRKQSNKSADTQKTDQLCKDKVDSGENKYTNALIAYQIQSDKQQRIFKNAIVLIKVEFKSNDPIALWILEENCIKKVQWSEESTLECKTLISFSISVGKAQDCINNLIKQRGLIGIMHNKDSRCSIISYSAKKWVTFQLVNETQSAQEIFLSTQKRAMSISFTQLTPDKLYIIVGLCKCFDQTQSSDAYLKYGMDVHQMSQNETNFSETVIKLIVQLPNDIVSRKDINSNHIYPVGFKKIQKQQNEQEQTEKKHSFQQMMRFSTKQFKKPDFEIKAFIFYADAVTKLPTPILVSGNTQTDERNNIGISQPIIRNQYFCDYPLLIYTTYHPLQNKIIIANLSQNIPKKLIDLGDYQLISFIETSFQRHQNEANRAKVYLLVKHRKENLMQIMRLDTSLWPVPEGHTNYEIQNIDTIDLLQNRPSFHLPVHFKIMKVVLFQGVSKFHADRPQYFLLIQLIDKLYQFHLHEQFNRHIQLEPDFKSKISFHRLVVGPNQTCYALTEHEQNYNAICKFSLEIQEDYWKIKTQVVYEQKARILHFQLDIEVDTIINHNLIFYDIEGKIKQLLFIEQNGKFIMNDDVKLKKQIQPWQKESLSYLEDCFWRTILIDSRCIISQSGNTTVSKKMILNLNSSLYVPVSDNQFQEILSFQPKTKIARRKKYKVESNQDTYYFLNQINLIKKQIGSIVNGTDCYFFVVPNMGQRRIDLVSLKTQSFCDLLYLIGNEIWIKLTKEQIVLIFKQNSMILDRVESCSSLFINTRLYKQSQYITRDYNMLFQYDSLGGFQLMREDFMTISAQAQILLDNALLELGFQSEYFQTTPAIDLDGNLGLLFFIKKQQSLNESTTDFFKISSSSLLENDVKKHKFLKRKCVQQDLPKIRMLKVEISQIKKNGAYDFCHQSQFSLNRCFIYLVLSTDELLIPSKDNINQNSVIFTKDYLCWRAKRRIHFVNTSEINVSNKDFESQKIQQKLESSKCGCVTINSLVFEDKFPDRITEFLRINQCLGSNCEISVRDKLRQNTIQIQLKKLNLIWDLDENEEIEFIYSPNQFDSDNFVRTGFVHYVETRDNFMPIGNNDDQYLFAVHAPNQRRLVLFQLFASIDSYTIKSLESFLKLGYFVKDIDPNLLTVNISGRTFFSIFYDQHDLLQIAYQQISKLENTLITNEWDEIQKDVNSILIRQIYHTLKLPIRQMGREGDEVSKIAKDFNLQSFENEIYDAHPRSLKQTIIEYSLYNDEVLLNLLIKFLFLSNEIRTHHVYQTFEDFFQFFRNDKLRGIFKKHNLQTDNCKRVNTLLCSDKEEYLFFGGNTTQYSDKYIKYRLEQAATKDIKDKQDFTLSKFIVFIYEIEWLQGNFRQFYKEISQIEDQTLFDDTTIIFLLEQLDFTPKVLIQFYIPELLNVAFTCYYFSFELTKVQTPNGYLDGSKWQVCQRIIIFIIDFYNFFGITFNIFISYYMTHKKIQKQSTTSKKIIVILYYLYFYAILFSKQFVIYKSCYLDGGSTQLSLVNFASVLILLMFVSNIYAKMIFFKKTAIYVQMITQTIYDIRYFSLLFLLLICFFGNAIMIIDRFQNDIANDGMDFNNQYDTILDPAKINGNEVAASLINQYLLGIGDFHYDNFNTNQSKVFLWVYFLLATFLTQILFLNMLIALMGTTYDEVMQNKDRQSLQKRTQLLSNFVYLCQIDHTKLQEDRYLYIAVKENRLLELGMENPFQNINESISDQLTKISEIQTQIQQEQSQHQQNLLESIKDFKLRLEQQKSEQKEIINSVKEHLQLVEQSKIAEIQRIKSQITLMQETYQINQKNNDKKLDSILKIVKSLQQNN